MHWRSGVTATPVAAVVRAAQVALAAYTRSKPASSSAGHQVGVADHPLQVDPARPRRDVVEPAEHEHHVVEVAGVAVPQVAGVDRDALAESLERLGHRPGEVGVAPALAAAARGCGDVERPAQDRQLLLVRRSATRRTTVRGVRAGASRGSRSVPGGRERSSQRRPTTSNPALAQASSDPAGAIGQRSCSARTPSEVVSRRGSWPALSTRGDCGTTTVAPPLVLGHPYPQLDLGQGVADPDVVPPEPDQLGTADRDHRRERGRDLAGRQGLRVADRVTGEEGLGMGATGAEHRAGTDHESGPVDHEGLGDRHVVVGESGHQPVEGVARRVGGRARQDHHLAGGVGDAEVGADRRPDARAGPRAGVRWGRSRAASPAAAPRPAAAGSRRRRARRRRSRDGATGCGSPSARCGRGRSWCAARCSPGAPRAAGAAPPASRPGDARGPWRSTAGPRRPASWDRSSRTRRTSRSRGEGRELEHQVERLGAAQGLVEAPDLGQEVTPHDEGRPGRRGRGRAGTSRPPSTARNHSPSGSGTRMAACASGAPSASRCPSITRRKSGCQVWSASAKAR